MKNGTVLESATLCTSQLSNERLPLPLQAEVTFPKKLRLVENNFLGHRIFPVESGRPDFMQRNRFASEMGNLFS